jgi:small-conductance mechanosensitive channel
LDLSQLLVLDYLIPIVVVIGAILLGLLTRPIVVRLLHHWKLGDLFTEALRAPYLLWWLLVGLTVAIQFLKAVTERLPNPMLWDQAIEYAHPLLLALLILSMTLVAASFLSRAVRHYAERAEPTAPVPTLPQTFIRIAVLALGLVMVLGVLGIPITPILTALGIGGLAVALALQDTLSNLFAGFYMTLARQIHLDDRIKLESGDEGYVADIS